MNSVYHHPVRNLTLNEILAVTGTKQENEFYVIHSSEVVSRLSICRPYRTDYFSVLLVKKGQLKIRFNLIEHTLSASSLFVMVPHGVYQFLHVSADCEFIAIGFTHHFLGLSGIHKKYIDAFHFFSSQHEPLSGILEQQVHTLTSILDLLKEKSHLEYKPPFNEEFIHHAFSLFIYELGMMFKDEHQPDAVRLSRKEDLAMKFVKLLPLHCKEERSVQYYADLLYVTPKYLTKCVREVTGRTCSELIDEMVIMEAKVLLDDLSLPISQVAEDLHFSDQFFFSKYFKRQAGQTPSEYRTQM